MNTRALPTRLIVLASLACVVAACGGRFDRAPIPPSLLRIHVPSGATPKTLQGVRAVQGVAHVAAISLVDVRVKGPAETSLKVAVVDPAEVQPIATALPSGATLPDGLSAGALLLAPETRAQLGVPPGSVVKVLGSRGGAHDVAVADFSGELTGTGAAGVVARQRVPWLEAGRPTVLFVAVAPGADANATAATLAQRLGTQVGLAAPRPAFLTGRAASQLFGFFSYVINGDGTIRQDPAWVRRYIVRARVPILGWVRCHRMMIPQLAAALADVQRAGLAKAVDLADFRESGGCYVARQILWDPAKPVSMHGWGLAIDFNVSRNQYGARPTMHPGVVEIFERWGFRWGGRWRTPDGMHFELTALVRR